MTTFIQQFIYGLSYGMNIAVAAAGLTLIFGVYRVLNLAHGQMIMLGGFTAYVVSTQLGLPYFVGFFASMFAMGVLGVVLEATVFRALQKRPVTDQLIASLGVFMMLGTIALRVWGDFQARTVTMPGEETSMMILGVRLDAARSLTFGISLALFASLYFIVYRTHLGRTMRAMALDEEAAALMGIRARRVAAIVFFMGSAMGGAAGALLGALFNVRPGMGFQPLLMALVVIIFGGMGSITGSIVAGLIVGLLYNLTVFYIGSTLGDLIPYGVLMVVLLFMPEGLFGRKMRQA